MRGGALRETVTIQVATLGTADAYGGQAEPWSDVETVRARIQGSGASERLAGRLALAEASHLVTMRYTRNMDQMKRLKWFDSVGGTVRYLYPTSVDADERSRQLVCACRETLT